MMRVAEARAASAEARRLAAEKGKEVEVWLGSKYEQLVESAEAIVQLSEAAEHVRTFVTSVEDRCSAALQVVVVKDDAKADVTEGEMSGREAAARIVQRSPLVWRSLDKDEHALALSYFQECRELTSKLVEPERAILEPYALQFEARIKARALEFIRREPLESAPASSKYSEALSARARLGEADDSLNMFFEARGAWIRSACDESRRAPIALARAARHLRRTVIDAAQIFVQGEFRLDSNVVAKRAIDWSRRSADVVRATAGDVLPRFAARAETEQFRDISRSIRAECDAQSEEWKEACAALFVVEEASTTFRERLGLKQAAMKKTVRRDVFVVNAAGAHARLTEAARSSKNRSGDSGLSDELRERCSLWRSVFAPTLLVLVDDRLRRGLQAARRDALNMLDAVDAAMLAAPSRVASQLEQAPALSTLDESTLPSAEARLAFLEGQNGMPVCTEKDSSEINWVGERIASWFDARLSALADDALSLGEHVLRDQDAASARRVVIEHVTPRYAEELGCFASELRTRAEAIGKRLDDYRRREETRIEQWCRDIMEPRVHFLHADFALAEARRIRLMAKALTIEKHAAKQARRDVASLLVLGRAAWSLAHATPRAASRLKVLCNPVSQSDDPFLLLDARAVVDQEQLRAAFDIADVDGDGVIEAAEAAEAAAALCVGELLATKAKRLLDRNSLPATLTFEELLLLATNALDADSRASVPQTAVECFANAHLVAIQHWARAVGGALVDNLSDQLLADATEWLDHTRKQPRPPRDWPKESEQLAILKTKARWRVRVLHGLLDEDQAAADEVVELPCEPTLAFGTFAIACAEQLEKASCAADYVLCSTRNPSQTRLDDNAPSHEVARRELHRVIGPGLVSAYASALEAAAGSELAPLSLAVDAYLLRFAYRRAVLRDNNDDAKCATYRHTGTTVFQTVADKIDPVDLELYGPFLKADAQRAYARSAIFLDSLFGFDPPDNAPSFDQSFKFCSESELPPDDFLDRPTNLLSSAPVVPPFPLLPEPTMPGDLAHDTPEYKAEYVRQSSAVLLAFVQQQTVRNKQDRG